ncbi:MAG: hypothetical protein GYA74_01890, partial [Acidobacteria bacterium]|nr:hypothetical protein [Acidobacteriota bacterium]
MRKKDKSLFERLGEEYDLRGRTQWVIFFSAILFAAFILLDRLYTPPMFHTFLVIRLAVLAAHGVLFLILRRTRSNRGAEMVAIALTVVDAGGISIMIQMLGGVSTAYVQGLYLVIMGVVVLVPLRFAASASLYALIWLGTAVPSIFRPPASGLQERATVSNLFFFSSVIILGLTGSYIM